MQFIKITTLLTAVSLLALTGCKKDDTVTTQPVQSQTVKNIAADTLVASSQAGQPALATGKYTLFSLKDGKTVANTDSATTKWDIGFRSTSIIVNGGTIRTGKGGAYVYTGTLDQLTTVPASATFATDQSATQPAIPTGSGNGWYNYDQTTNIISPIPGRVLVIRTGDGNYAKVEILSYYKDAPAQPAATSKSRFYTLRYVYQPDGSMKLN